MLKQYSFLSENNQTISRFVRNAHRFGYDYWKSGQRDADKKDGIYHIYRTKKDEDGNIKIKRIKKEFSKKENNIKSKKLKK